MGLKNDNVNKAEKTDDTTASKVTRKMKGYQVKAGDNWFSIAEKIYGDQRMAGMLMEANSDISVLQQGQTLHLPAMPDLAAGEGAFFSQDTVDIAVDNESVRDAAVLANYDELLGSEETSLTPDDLKLAEELAAAMDALDEGDFGPTDAVTDGAALADKTMPEPRSDATEAPKTATERLADKVDRLGFEGEVAPAGGGEKWRKLMGL